MLQCLVQMSYKYLLDTCDNIVVKWNLTIKVTHGTEQKWPYWRGDLIKGGYLHWWKQFGTEPLQR